MDGKEQRRYDEEISYLKFRLGIAEDYIVACRSGENIDPEKLEEAIAVRDSILQLLDKRLAVVSNERTVKDLHEEILLRLNRKE